MKNLENVKALNDMEMAMVAGGLYWIPENVTGCFLEKPNGCFLEKPNGCFLEKPNGRFLLKPPQTSADEPLTRRIKF